jgi:hypothetical protein
MQVRRRREVPNWSLRILSDPHREDPRQGHPAPRNRGASLSPVGANVTAGDEPYI